MKKKIATILKKSGVPAFVAAKTDNTADIMFRVYTITANDGETTVLIGGGDGDKHSPIDGERIEPKEGISETSAYADASQSFPVIAHCKKCDHDVCAPKELAAQLDGVDFHCVNCGEEVRADYSADLNELASDDDEDEDDSLDVDDDAADDEDITDAVEDTADSEDGDMTEEPDGDTDDGSQDTDDSEDDEEDSEEDASVADASTVTEATSEPVVEEVEKPPVTNIDVVSARCANIDSTNIRVVQAAAKRYELFCDDLHLGHLNLDLASTPVAHLATNSQQFTRSIIMTLATDLGELQKTGKVTENLANFGLVLAEVSVPIADAVDQMVTEKVTEIENKQSEQSEAQSDAITAAMTIAMAGLNKGILPGPNLVTAFAKVLTRFGVKNATEEATRAVEEVSVPFLKAAQEKATEIIKQGPDYARGLSVSIASAQFVRPEVEDVSKVTAAVFTLPRPINQPAPRIEVASVQNQSDRAAKFRSLFRRM